MIIVYSFLDESFFRLFSCICSVSLCSFVEVAIFDRKNFLMIKDLHRVHFHDKREANKQIKVYSFIMLNEKGGQFENLISTQIFSQFKSGE